MAAGEQLDVEWAIGDAVLAEIAAGADLEAAKSAAAQATRRDKSDVTLVVRTCEAFPAGVRRPDLPFAHHLAVIALPEADRLALLARSTGEGWSTRDIRREVVRARVAAGDFYPTEEDPEDRAYRSMAQAWNRAPLSSRELFAESVEEAGVDDIEL